MLFSDGLQNWFINQECTLFENRLLGLREEEYIKILEQNVDKKVERASLDEKQRFKQELAQIARMFGDKFDENSAIYKVHFTSVLKLVARRAVFLYKGKAYISDKNVTAILLQEYREKLQKEMERINKLWYSELVKSVYYL